MESSRILSLLSAGIVTLAVISGVATAQNSNAGSSAISAKPEPRRPTRSPRSWAERAYPKLIHYNKFDKGQSLRQTNGK